MPSPDGPISTTQNSQPATGRVYLVAAGPGDPRLLTLRAARLIETCDVILFDALANPWLLDRAQPNAIRVSVGKHGEDKIWDQNEIHAEIVKHARAGKSVLRLKGGDTAIFARTGEEIEFLRASDIPFEVVPGVTAASAASAYAGIPLTHRDWSSAVAFITGHQQSSDGNAESDEDVDWSALARFPGTLVLYMAVTNTARWSRALIDGGMAPTTAVAIVRHASLPIQKTTLTTLSQVAQVIEGPPKMRPPIVFIIGPVTELQTTMDWFTQQPLFGTTILLTRPAGQNEPLAEQLIAIGANVLIQPALQISSPQPGSEFDQSLNAAVDRVNTFDWIVFSSANGVHYWMKAVLNRNPDIRSMSKPRFAGVGPSVREALGRYHVACEVCLDEDLNAEHLAAELASRVHGQRVLIVTTNKARTTLQDLLSTQADCESVIAYVSQPVTELPANLIQALRPIQRLHILATSVASVEAMHPLLSSQKIDLVWLSLSDRIIASLQSLGHHDIVSISAITPTAIQDAITQQP